MPIALNMLPVRVPIGQFINDQGKAVSVFMSQEFARSMSDLLSRVGGPIAPSTDDLVTLAFVGDSESSNVAALKAMITELSVRLVMAEAVATKIAGVERKLEEVLRLQSIEGPKPVDWEHPGKIGAASPNSGKFSTLEATKKVRLSPVDADVELKPTGNTLMTIQPPAGKPGLIDNMDIGTNIPRPARFSSINRITFTQPATGATITMEDGAILTVPGAGGTLGSAAYTPSGAYASRTATTLGPAATDAATTQALVNNLRTACLQCGIGS